MSKGRFPDVPTAIDFPKSEAKTLAFWKEQAIFEKTLTHRKGSA